MIAKIGSENLRKVLDGLNQTNRLILSPKSFRKVLEAEVGTEMARVLRRQLFALAALCRSGEHKAEDIVESLTNELKVDWSESDFGTWVQVAPVITILLVHERVQVAAKALELAVNYSNLLSDVDILTDIRPIFDTNHATIAGTVISHTLRLRTTSAGRVESISVSMDDNDVRLLLDLCKEALKKADVSMNLISDGCNIEAFKVGDEFYD